jgi:putative transposase
VPDPDHERPGDLINRQFTAPGPNLRWCADFTHVPTHTGTVYVALLVDIYSRAIAGWSAATSKHTKLVLDALDMALWRRGRQGHRPIDGLIHHSEAGSAYTSFRFAAHLAEAGIAASIGTVGDAYDNALMESTIGLYKTELIKPRQSWKDMTQIEYATAEWAEWYNNHRLHSAIDDLTPAELEAVHYANQANHDKVAVTQT